MESPASTVDDGVLPDGDVILGMEFVGGAKREVRGLVPVIQEIFRFPLQCCNALVQHGLTLLF